MTTNKGNVMTIPAYMEAVMEHHEWYSPMIHHDEWRELGADFPIDSHCGVIARRMIDACATLAATMTEQRWRQEMIVNVESNIMTICFG